MAISVATQRYLAFGTVALGAAMLVSCVSSLLPVVAPEPVASCPAPADVAVIWEYSGTGYRANDIAVSGDIAIVVGQTKLNGLVVVLDTATGDRRSFFPGPRIAKAVAATADQGYVVAGGTRVRALVDRFDADGQSLWRATSAIDFTVAHAVVSDGDGGFFVVGQVGEGPRSRPWTAVVDASGDMIREKTLPDPGALLSVTSTNAGYAVVGVVVDDGPRMSAGLMDGAGDIVWSRIIDTSESAIGQGIAISGEDFLVSGFSGSGTVVSHVSSTGSLSWQRQHADILGNGAHHALARRGSSYIVAGSYAGEARVSAFGEDGCLMWRFRTAEAKIARSVTVLADGDVLLAGDRADGGGFRVVRLRPDSPPVADADETLPVFSSGD